MQITITDKKWPAVQFEESESRKEGVHLSDVIKSLQDKAGIGPKATGGFKDLELAGEIGILWERVLAKVMSEKYSHRPNQIRKDGIWMSPDGIGPDPDGIVPVVLKEYKAAWKSSAKPIDTNFYYMAQVKSYCYALDLNVAMMHIFYVMGDYRGSGPLYREARLKFSKDELRDNWKMIVKHKEDYFDIEI